MGGCVAFTEPHGNVPDIFPFILEYPHAQSGQTVDERMIMQPSLALAEFSGDAIADLMTRFPDAFPHLRQFSINKIRFNPSPLLTVQRRQRGQRIV
jgi:hypothetical protein